uniref:Uncharacterized protein n=1 Tax=Sphaerodactylus townsendi TaxID=933632 RepID=A0ACB8ESW0_9SAUR
MAWEPSVGWNGKRRKALSKTSHSAEGAQGSIVDSLLTTTPRGKSSSEAGVNKRVLSFLRKSKDSSRRMKILLLLACLLAITVPFEASSSESKERSTPCSTSPPCSTSTPCLIGLISLLAQVRCVHTSRLSKLSEMRFASLAA